MVNIQPIKMVMTRGWFITLLYKDYMISTAYVYIITHIGHMPFLENPTMYFSGALEESA